MGARQNRKYTLFIFSCNIIILNEMIILLCALLFTVIVKIIVLFVFNDVTKSYCFTEINLIVINLIITNTYL